MKSTKYAPRYYETRPPALIRQQRAQQLAARVKRKKPNLDEYVIGGQMNGLGDIDVLRLGAYDCAGFNLIADLVSIESYMSASNVIISIAKHRYEKTIVSRSMSEFLNGDGETQWGLRIAKTHKDDESAFSELCDLVTEVDGANEGRYLKGRCVREFLAKIASEYKKELLMDELEA